MNSQRNFQTFSFPVPVRKSRFVALFGKHDFLNIQTDMGQIPTFSVPKKQNARNLLWTDPQCTPNNNYLPVLGSGRAGCYRGYYLKGIGRTPLTGLWHSNSEIYHNSGHMMLSAGIREFVVSSLLKALGLGHRIVPCEGLLIAKLDHKLKYYSEIAFGQGAAPVDSKFQCISIKKNVPFRHSHLLWILMRQGPQSLPTVFQILSQQFGATLANPKKLAEAFIQRSEKSIVEYIDFALNGVFWGSLQNNFTLDGRFLDLETPTLTGSGFIGHFFSPQLTDSSTRSTLLEVFGFRELLKENLIAVNNQLITVLKNSDTQSRIIKQAIEFQNSFHSQLCENSILMNSNKFEKVLFERLVPLANSQKISKNNLLAWIQNQTPLPKSSCTSSLVLASSEPGLKKTPVIYGQRPFLAHPEIGYAINSFLIDLDHATNLDYILNQLRSTPRFLKSLLKKANRI
jgi:hypothetical protein